MTINPGARRRLAVWLVAIMLVHSFAIVAGAASSKWQPTIRLDARVGSRTSGSATLMLPLSQAEDRLLFADLRGVAADDPSREGNVGLGYRWILPHERSIAGAYLFRDLRTTASGNEWQQTTAGFELLGQSHDLRLNAYIPATERKLVSSVIDDAVVIRGRTLIYEDALLNTYETAMGGFDIGYTRRFDTVPNETSISLRGFHFFAPDTTSVTGANVRFETRINDLFNVSGSQLILGLEGQTDTVRGNQGFVSVGFSLPIGSGVLSSQNDQFDLRQRMMEPIQRDIDIVVNHTNDVREIQEESPAEEVLGGNTVSEVLFVSASGRQDGEGDADDPLSVEGLNARLLAGEEEESILVIPIGDDEIHTGQSGIILVPGTILMSAGKLQFRSMSSGREVALIRNVTPATVINDDGAAVIVTENNSIVGIRINGGTHSVWGDDVSGAIRLIESEFLGATQGVIDLTVADDASIDLEIVDSIIRGAGGLELNLDNAAGANVLLQTSDIGSTNGTALRMLGSVLGDVKIHFVGSTIDAAGDGTSIDLRSDESIEILLRDAAIGAAGQSVIETQAHGDNTLRVEGSSMDSGTVRLEQYSEEGKATAVIVEGEIHAEDHMRIVTSTDGGNALTQVWSSEIGSTYDVFLGAKAYTTGQATVWLENSYIHGGDKVTALGYALVGEAEVTVSDSLITADHDARLSAWSDEGNAYIDVVSGSTIASGTDVTINAHGSEVGQIDIDASTISAFNDVLVTVDAYTEEITILGDSLGDDEDDADEVEQPMNHAVLTMTDSHMTAGGDIEVGALAVRGDAHVVVTQSLISAAAGADLRAESKRRGNAYIEIMESHMSADLLNLDASAVIGNAHIVVTGSELQSHRDLSVSTHTLAGISDIAFVEGNQVTAAGDINVDANAILGTATVLIGVNDEQDGDEEHDDQLTSLSVSNTLEAAGGLYASANTRLGTAGVIVSGDNDLHGAEVGLVAHSLLGDGYVSVSGSNDLRSRGVMVIDTGTVIGTSNVTLDGENALSAKGELVVNAHTDLLGTADVHIVGANQLRSKGGATVSAHTAIGTAEVRAGGSNTLQAKEDLTILATSLVGDAEVAVVGDNSLRGRDTSLEAQSLLGDANVSVIGTNDLTAKDTLSLDARTVLGDAQVLLYEENHLSSRDALLLGARAILGDAVVAVFEKNDLYARESLSINVDATFGEAGIVALGENDLRTRGVLNLDAHATKGDAGVAFIGENDLLGGHLLLGAHSMLGDGIISVSGSNDLRSRGVMVIDTGTSVGSANVSMDGDNALRARDELVVNAHTDLLGSASVGIEGANQLRSKGEAIVSAHTALGSSKVSVKGNNILRTKDDMTVLATSLMGDASTVIRGADITVAGDATINAQSKVGDAKVVVKKADLTAGDVGFDAATALGSAEVMIEKSSITAAGDIDLSAFSLLGGTADITVDQSRLRSQVDGDVTLDAKAVTGSASVYLSDSVVNVVGGGVGLSADSSTLLVGKEAYVVVFDSEIDAAGDLNIAASGRNVAGILLGNLDSDVESGNDVTVGGGINIQAHASNGDAGFFALDNTITSSDSLSIDVKSSRGEALLLVVDSVIDVAHGNGLELTIKASKGSQVRVLDNSIHAQGLAVDVVAKRNTTIDSLVLSGNTFTRPIVDLTAKVFRFETESGAEIFYALEDNDLEVTDGYDPVDIVEASPGSIIDIS